MHIHEHIKKGFAGKCKLIRLSKRTCGKKTISSVIVSNTVDLVTERRKNPERKETNKD
jgi:hypothetical protein